jgi:hypothetical protein
VMLLAKRIALADASQVNFLVTGDHEVLSPKQHESTRMNIALRDDRGPKGNRGRRTTEGRVKGLPLTTQAAVSSQ